MSALARFCLKIYFFLARFGALRKDKQQGGVEEKKIFLAPSKCFVWRERVPLRSPKGVGVRGEKMESESAAMMFCRFFGSNAVELFQLADGFCGRIK